MPKKAKDLKVGDVFADANGDTCIVLRTTEIGARAVNIEYDTFPTHLFPRPYVVKPHTRYGTDEDIVKETATILATAHWGLEDNAITVNSKGAAMDIITKEWRDGHFDLD